MLFVESQKGKGEPKCFSSKDYKYGGLKLPHIRSQIKALKGRWIRYLLLENDEWTNVFQGVTGFEDSNMILSLDSKSLQRLANSIDNIF